MSVIDVLWKQKDGTLIAVSEMDTSHVENALGMIKRERDLIGGIGLDNADDPRLTDIARTRIKKIDWWIITFKAELERRNTAWLLDP